MHFRIISLHIVKTHPSPSRPKPFEPKRRKHRDSLQMISTGWRTIGFEVNLSVSITRMAEPTMVCASKSSIERMMSQNTVKSFAETTLQPSPLVGRLCGEFSP
jgi:hypothetical protein